MSTSKFLVSKRESDAQHHARMIIGAPNMNALKKNGLQVVKCEDAILLYNAEILEKNGMDWRGAIELLNHDP